MGRPISLILLIVWVLLDQSFPGHHQSAKLPIYEKTARSSGRLAAPVIARIGPSLTASIPGEVGMQRLDDLRAFADGGTDALDGAGADIADREDAGDR